MVALAALPQTEAARSLAVARTLGYGRIAGWLKLVLPRLYPQIRLPVFAVLAYSVSTVEVAMILAQARELPFQRRAFVIYHGVRRPCVVASRLRRVPAR